LLQVIRHMLGQQNVPGIAAIHDSLRYIDASAGNVRLFIQVGNFADRTAVNPHPHPKFRMFF